MSLYDLAEQASRNVIDAFELQAAQNVADLTGTIAQLTVELSNANTELTTTQGLLDDANDENAELVQTIGQLNTVITQLNTTIAELGARIEELENPTPPDPGVLEYWGAPAWRDEFDGSAIDPAKWNVWDRTTLGLLADTGEAKASACSIVNGNLRIRALWRDPVVTTAQGGSNTRGLTHTTGYVSHIRADKTRIYEQKYGRWEIRAKIPTGANTRGTLPAFWLRNTKQGEIDIMEAWGGGGTMSSSYNTYTKDTGTTTIHSSTNRTTVNGKPYRKTFWRWFQQGIPRDLPVGFHKFAFEYTPAYMALIVDDVERVRITPDSPDPVNGGTLAWLWDSDFFDSPLHVRLNLHIGPEAGERTPDPNNRQWTLDPLDYEIEYVRIWAMPA